MPQYHFNVRDGEAPEDQDAVDLADVNAAGLAAVRLLGEMLTARPETLWRNEALSVVVTDASGLTLFSVDATLSCAPAIVAMRSPSRRQDS